MNIDLMKNVSGSLLGFGVALLLFSCGGKSENPQARALLDSAQSSYDRHDASAAMVYLDSLQKSFPDQTGVQREAMALRPKVIALLTQSRLDSVDASIKADLATLSNLKPKLKWVKTPGMIEGYWIAPELYRADFMNTTGIEARVSEIGEFYIVSSVNPAGGLRHVSVEMQTSDGSAATPAVVYDGESNYRISGGEVITFSPEQSVAIGELAMKTAEGKPSASANVVFHGAKGRKTMKMSAAQLQGVARAYAYSAAMIRAREAQVEQERLKRTAEIAQRQAAALGESNAE